MSVAVSASPMPHDSASPQPGGTTVLPNGRLRDDGLADADRHFGVAMHLSPLASSIIGPLGWIAPLVLWLIRKDQSPFNDDHGREVLNMLLTGLVFGVLAIPLAIVVVGLLLYAAWLITMLVNMIRGAVAAGNGEYFRYPMIIRFV